jgi:hypothetical protein
VNTYSWTVVADPSAPTATKSPAVATVCVGTTLSLTGVTLGGGGTGGCTIEYSANGGTWTTAPPVISAIAGVNSISIRTSCGGLGCNTSSVNQYTWTGQPIAPVANAGGNQTGASTCGLTTVNLSANTASPGVGSWSVVTGTGGSFGNTSSPNSTFTGVSGNSYELRWTITNAPCPTTTDEVLVTLNQEPLITSSNTSMCQDDTRTLTSNLPGVTWKVNGVPIAGNVFTAPNPGGFSAVYTMTAVLGPCESFGQNIIVYGKPTITSSATNMCAGDVRVLSAFPSGGTFSGPGVSFSSPNYIFTAPTPSGGNQTYTITYTLGGSLCPGTTQDIEVYGDPTFASAGTDIEACIGLGTTMGASAPTIGTGTWTWSPSAPTYTGGTTANDEDAQVVFGTAGTYTGTWTTTNGPCAVTFSDDVLVDVNSSATNMALVTGSSVTAVEVCVESPWTYYATPAKPDEYLFAIKKNANTFTANITITDVPGTAPIESLGGQPLLRGTWLLSRYWNAELTSGSISSSVSIRFFIDAAELTEAQSDANAFVGTHPWATTVTPLTFFKTTGTAFDPSTMLINGDFTFTPTYLNQVAVGTTNGILYFELDGITSFSGGTGGFSVNDDGSPLPVELLGFEANAIDNQYIKLDWATATEINNDGFELRRSTDGVNFERIAWIGGNGNSSVVNEYVYNDYEVNKGVTYYYQLKQVDYDGEFELFDVVSATLSGEEGFSIGNIIPNPSKENNMIRVNVQSTQEEAMSIQIYNHVGVKVSSLVRTINLGENSIEIDIRDLASGTYFVSFESTYGTETRKLVVIK